MACLVDPFVAQVTCHELIVLETLRVLNFQLTVSPTAHHAQLSVSARTLCADPIVDIFTHANGRHALLVPRVPASGASNKETFVPAVPAHFASITPLVSAPAHHSCGLQRNSIYADLDNNQAILPCGDQLGGVHDLRDLLGAKDGGMDPGGSLDTLIICQGFQVQHLANVDRAHGSDLIPRRDVKLRAQGGLDCWLE